ALRAVGVDAAGPGVAGEVGPADAAGDDVGVPDVEAVLPEHFTGLGVERHDALALVDAFAVVVDDEHLAAHDHRGGAAAVGRPPDEVGVGGIRVERPLVGQVGFAGDAVLLRPAPVDPVRGRGGHHE